MTTTKKKKTTKLNGASAKPAPATPRTRFVKALIAHGKRLQKFAAQLGLDLDREGDVLALTNAAQAAFDVAETVQDTFPADWKPRGSGPAKKTDWKPGDAITIVKSWRSTYDGFIEPKDMDAMVLDKLVNDKVAVVKLANGEKARVRIRHLSARA